MIICLKISLNEEGGGCQETHPLMKRRENCFNSAFLEVTAFMKTDFPELSTLVTNFKKWHFGAASKKSPSIGLWTTSNLFWNLAYTSILFRHTKKKWKDWLIEGDGLRNSENKAAFYYVR